MYSGKELKLARISKDISQLELAYHLGFDQSYISKMENGVQTIPQHIYEKWVNFLGLKLK